MKFEKRTKSECTEGYLSRLESVFQLGNPARNPAPVR